MIQLKDLCLSFGQRAIFDHISYFVQPEQKIGLVGRNGSGKSTLLKAIAGQQGLDSGSVAMPKDFRCAYMAQDVVLVSHKTIVNEALCACEGFEQLIEQLDALEQKKANNSLSEQELDSYSALHCHLFEVGYDYKRSRAEKMLIGLGFKQEKLQDAVDTLSVGWKMRLVLAKLLLQDADFYLFDEPTNHLDLYAKDWFIDFLSNARFGFILVSHDEYFLDVVCDHIAEISMGKLTVYTGSYQTYIEQKEANRNLLEKKYIEQQKYIKKQQETIDRFRATASRASMVQSMIKALDKIERIELEHEQQDIRFSLPPTQRPGKIVLDCAHVGYAFGINTIFEHATFQIFRGRKVGLVAPNGMGKTTLLNVLMGKYTPTHGTISLGHNVTAAFFEQEQNKTLTPTNTVLEEVENACPSTEERMRARGLLGAFLFSGDDVYKKISVLSGGEKNRVAMVKILLQNANFLVLDEPTNHLDIASKNILLRALLQFDGTILFVSHDRSFLNGLATDIVELTSQRAFTYAGNYDEYLYHKKHMGTESSSTAVSHPVATTAGKQHQMARKYNDSTYRQLQKVIKKIETLEKHKVETIRVFEEVAFGTKEYEDALARLQKIERDLALHTKTWEQLELQNDNVLPSREKK
ncbi:MAG: ABC-F family ATP-binding cassette domain-containing protein [Candidatus Babeliales bacterium]|jgi:ATP-binding cassette subfamily F protein 3